MHFSRSRGASGQHADAWEQNKKKPFEILYVQFMVFVVTWTAFEFVL